MNKVYKWIFRKYKYQLESEINLNNFDPELSYKGAQENEKEEAP